MRATPCTHHAARVGGGSCVGLSELVELAGVICDDGQEYHDDHGGSGCAEDESDVVPNAFRHDRWESRHDRGDDQ